MVPVKGMAPLMIPEIIGGGAGKGTTVETCSPCRATGAVPPAMATTVVVSLPRVTVSVASMVEVCESEEIEQTSGRWGSAFTNLTRHTDPTGMPVTASARMLGKMGTCVDLGRLRVVSVGRTSTVWPVTFWIVYS